MDDERTTAEGDPSSGSSTDAPAERGRVVLTGPHVVPGKFIGRYRVIQELGSGTMGVVYAAHDPELDRKLAIKVLKSRRDDQAASRVRLQREAQALAKLSHRNVVGVYDVGVHDGQLFLAMEFVEGVTLRDWLEDDEDGTRAEDQPRSWPEVLRIMTEAGRGLAAAHGAGFVHRDFKPDNVMLDVGGRVKVMDFGLARAEIHEPRGAKVPPGSSGELEVLAEIPTFAGPLTQTGTIMGTPGYMARELFRGQPADARSDQFAFCVSLYEALYGERPFPGRNMSQLLGAVAEGRVSDAPPNARVPAWLRKVVLRGLSGEPGERWPSIQALLDALASGPRQARRRKLGLVVASIGLVWALVALALVIRDLRACRGLSSETDAVWNDGRRAEIADHFGASGVSYAGDAWRRVERGLDGYATQWVKARTTVCEAERRAALSDTEQRLRLACLDAGLQHLRATIEVLAEADAATVGRAVEMVAQLPRLERCEDIETLARNADPISSLGASERVTALEQQLAAAEALEKAGKYSQGLAITHEVLTAANELSNERLVARARLREGILQRRAGRYAEAAAALEQAYVISLSLRMHAEAAEASATLVFVLGYQLAQTEAGWRWALDAEALARAAGTDEAQALYLNNIGALAYAEAKFDEARSAWQRAFTLRERALGPSHPTVAGSLNNLGVLAHAEGRYDEARDYHQRALALWTEALGPNHPQTSYSLNHLGTVAREQGRYDESLELHEAALDIRERALGPQHSLVADTLVNLGQLFEAKQDHARALGYHQRALAIYEAAFGPTHPFVAKALTELGKAQLALGQTQAAREALERALVTLEREPGDRSVIGSARFALARAIDGRGRADRQRARELAVLARQDFEAAGLKSARDLMAVVAYLAGRRR